jgi:hypothetical protein
MGRTSRPLIKRCVSYGVAEAETWQHANNLKPRYLTITIDFELWMLDVECCVFVCLSHSSNSQ